MRIVVVLCLTAAFLGLCKADFSPAEETDLELVAADTDSGNWTANLGDMEINIEHKHGIDNPVQNASGSWTLDISRTTFQKQGNSDIEDSHELNEEIAIDKSSTGASEHHNNEDTENQSLNNEIDNDIPVDEFQKKDDLSYFPQPQEPFLRPENPQLPRQEIRLNLPFQTWLYGRPNYLYEMLPPREDSIMPTSLYPQYGLGQNLEMQVPREESMISTLSYNPVEKTKNPEELDILTHYPDYQNEQTQNSEYVTDELDDQQAKRVPLFGWDVPNPQIKSHESQDETDDTNDAILDSDGFEHFNGVGWFNLDSRNTNWEGARDACAAVGAHLAVPDTPERVKVFLKLFQRHPEIPAQAILRQQAYIGVHDPENNRQFTTVQGKPFNPGFPIWFLNEPDNAPPGESCVTFHTEGRTRDVPCFYNLPFFCEKDIPVASKEQEQ